MANVTVTIDGRAISAAPGTLLIEAAKQAGIEIPAFCYYEGYSLQAACRMCLIEIEKMPGGGLQSHDGGPVCCCNREI